MKYWLLITYLFISNNCISQQEITEYTVTYQNNRNDIRIIQTTIRQYYNDSSCVWEISFPQVDGLKDWEVQRSLNIELSNQVSFGDCDIDKECDENYRWYPRMEFYWNKVEITCIHNDLLSFQIIEGGQPYGYDRKFSDIRCFFYDLKTGYDIDTRAFFKEDDESQQQLEQILISRLGFVPEEEPLRTMRQYYFDCKQLIVLYDRYTIGEDQIYHIPLVYDDIKDLINPSGFLAGYFDGQSKSQTKK